MAASVDGIRRAEILIEVGRHGLRAHLRGFDAALRGEGGRVRPVARLLLPPPSKAVGVTVTGGQVWESLGVEGKEGEDVSLKGQLEFEGSEWGASWRAEMGLIKYQGEKWPNIIHVRRPEGSSAMKVDLTGSYRRLNCRYSVVQGALWHRDTPVDQYLFYVPDRDRTGPDLLSFSFSPQYGHSAAITATLSPEFTPQSLRAISGRGTETQKKKKIKSDQKRVVTVSVNQIVWSPAPGIHFCSTSPSALRTSGPELMSPGEAVGKAVVITRLLGNGSIHPLPPLLLREAQSNAQGELRLLGAGAAGALTQRKLGAVAASALARYAAKGGLEKVSVEWIALREGDEAWGRDERYVPPRPREEWNEKGVRSYDQEASNGFELALLRRPHPWKVQVKSAPSGAWEIIFQARPEAVAHKAIPTSTLILSITLTLTLTLIGS